MNIIIKDITIDEKEFNIFYNRLKSLYSKYFNNNEIKLSIDLKIKNNIKYKPFKELIELIVLDNSKKDSRINGYKKNIKNNFIILKVINRDVFLSILKEELIQLKYKSYSLQKDKFDIFIESNIYTKYDYNEISCEIKNRTYISKEEFYNLNHKNKEILTSYIYLKDNDIFVNEKKVYSLEQIKEPINLNFNNSKNIVSSTKDKIKNYRIKVLPHSNSDLYSRFIFEYQINKNKYSFIRHFSNEVIEDFCNRINKIITK